MKVVFFLNLSHCGLQHNVRLEIREHTLPSAGEQSAVKTDGEGRVFPERFIHLFISFYCCCI